MRKRLRQFVTVAFQIGALACIFPMDHPAAYWWIAHAETVALGYLVVSLVALVCDWPKLMFVSLGCSAIIGLYYHEKALYVAPLPHPHEVKMPPSSLDAPQHEPTATHQ